MAGKIEYLQSKVQCDLCDFTASGQEVGAHIAHTHHRELLDEAYKHIFAAGPKGLTRAGLQKATGWSMNRAASVTKSLEKKGLVVSDQLRPLRYFDRSVKTETMPTRGGGAVVNVQSANLPTEDTNKFIEQINRKAMSELAKRHPDEFKKLFLASLIESKINDMNDAELTTLLDVTLNI